MSKKSNEKSGQELLAMANALMTPEGIAELDEALDHAEAAHSKKTAEPSKSDLIRSMYEDGVSISEISRSLNAHYSFVYQVCKKYAGGVGEFSTHQDKGPTRSEEMRRLWDAKLNIGDIAKQLNANYSYVWSVVDAYRRKQEIEARAAKTAGTV